MSDSSVEQISLILIDAAYMGDKKAAQKWGITDRSVRRYRARMATDSELSAYVLKRKQQAEKTWAEDLSLAIKAGIAFLSESTQALSKRDPEAVKAVNESVKTLTDVAIMREVLDARLAEYRQTD